MHNIRYYQHVPIMRRILEHIEHSVYVVGNLPSEPASQFRRYSDIMNAMGDGSDISRSHLDFAGVNLFIDVEYGNRLLPGEIFHQPLVAFEKLEGLRKSIRDFLEKKHIPYLELMTGQGYNYVSRIRRESASYASLAELGQRLKVLPWSAAKQLIQKEKKHGNIPLLADSLVFGALGRISEFMYSQVERAYGDLPIEPADIHEHDEIAILDTTQYGYLITNRSNRIAFSLHQKSLKKPEMRYYGPPISTITPQGLSLEQRVDIRSDTSDNYAKAAQLAGEARTTIPEADVSFLVTSYLMSQTYEQHRHEADERLETTIGEEEIATLNALYPEMDPTGVFWGVPPQPDWRTINAAPISHHARRVIDFPNDLLLKPRDIKHLASELRDHGIARSEIVSLIAFKYSENHGWNADLTRNDAMLRADYWLRTLLPEDR